MQVENKCDQNLRKIYNIWALNKPNRNKNLSIQFSVVYNITFDPNWSY